MDCDCLCEQLGAGIVRDNVLEAEVQNLFDMLQTQLDQNSRCRSQPGCLFFFLGNHLLIVSDLAWGCECSDSHHNLPSEHQ